MDRSKRSAGSWKGRFTPSFNFTNRPRKTCFSLIIILSILTILKTFIVDPFLLQDYEVLSDDQSNLTSPNSSDPVPEPQNKTTYPPIPLLYLLQARKDYLDQVVSCDGSDTGDLILSKPTFLRCGKDSAARTYKQKVGNRIQNGPLRYESLKKAFDADKLQKERTRSEIRGALRKTPKMVESFDEDVIWINETREWERGWGAEKGEEREFRISKAFSGIGRGATLMECAVMDTTVPERFCLTKNVALRMSLLPKLPAQPMDHRKYSLPPSFGTLMGSCLLNETWWFHGELFGKGAAGWLYDGLNIHDPMIDRSEIHCNAWVETPVFFISRHEAVNPFQAHQDFLNTFIVYASLGEDVRNYQPVFLDSRIADGSMVAAWSHLFSSSKRLLDIRQIVDVASSYVPSGSASQNICFRKAIWGIHGALSSLSKGNRVHGACQISPLLFAFRNFMLDRLKEALNVTELVSPIKYEERKDNSTLGRFAPMWKKKLLGERTTVTITYALRGEGSRLDPHGFLFNTSKNGLADLYGTNFDDEEEEEPSDLIRRDHVHRKLKGEASLVDHLRQKITSWTTWNVQYIFNAVDFATLSFEEQVAMAQNTDVLVAPHGAVFVHLLYLRMKPVAGAVEIKMPSKRMLNEQFRNLARKLRQRYQAVKVTDKFDADTLHIENAVKRVVNDVIAIRREAKLSGPSYIPPDSTHPVTK